MSDMDTNSIQPIEKNDVVRNDALTDINVGSGLSSFGRYFLSITNVFGILPVSLTLAFLATGLGLALPRFSFFGWSIVWAYGMSGLISAIVSIVVWTLMKSFELPRLVRLSISIWTPSIVGLSAMLPMISLVSWEKIFSNVVFLDFMIPSIAGGIIALLPYFYRDYLESKNLGAISSHKLLEVNSDDREHTLLLQNRSDDGQQS